MTVASQPAFAEMIRVRTEIEASAEKVWDAVRDVYNVETRLVPGMVASTEQADDGTRVVTFANGFVVRERIVSMDDDARRMSYTSVGGQSTFHMASMEVIETQGGCELVWTTDVLPAELSGFIEGNMRAGSAVMKATLEAEAHP